eukprot:666661-Amphidinium_carterae.1
MGLGLHLGWLEMVRAFRRNLLVPVVISVMNQPLQRIIVTYASEHLSRNCQRRVASFSTLLCAWRLHCGARQSRTAAVAHRDVLWLMSAENGISFMNRASTELSPSVASVQLSRDVRAFTDVSCGHV